MTDTLLPDAIASALTTERFGQSLRYHHAVGSTNAVAADWAREGAPEGAVVLAEQQTAGRGRHGRSWVAPPHQALTGSVVLRPELPTELLSLIPLAASLAVADVLSTYPLADPPQIKWPNDVLIGGRKCCGMLLETSMRATGGASPRRSPVVLGIGLNVNQTELPSGAGATSLRMQVGRSVPRAPLWAALMKQLEARYDALHDPNARTALRTAYTEQMLHYGKTITVRVPGAERTATGTVVGIDPSGALRLRTPRGVQAFHAGEVTTRTA